MIEKLFIDEIAERMLKEINYLGRTYRDKKDKMMYYVHVNKHSTIYDIFNSDGLICKRPYPSIEYKELIDSFNIAIKLGSFVKVMNLVITPTSIDGRRIGPFIRKIKSVGQGKIRKYDIIEARIEDYSFRRYGIVYLARQKSLIDFLEEVEKIYKTMKT